MRVRTRNELIAMRAAEHLADALAKANGSLESGLLLHVALLQAEEDIGGKPTRNAVVMVSPLKAVLQGHPIVIAPRGDDGPLRITK